MFVKIPVDDDVFIQTTIPIIIIETAGITVARTIIYVLLAGVTSGRKPTAVEFVVDVKEVIEIEVSDDSRVVVMRNVVLEIGGD